MSNVMMRAEMLRFVVYIEIKLWLAKRDYKILVS